MRFFNRPLRILLATNALVLFAGAMLGPVYALFVTGNGGDLLDASFAGTAYALAAGLTVIVTGRLSDKVKEGELIIVLGYVVLGLAFLAYIPFHSIKAIMVLQMVVGFGEALYSPPFDAVYSRHLDRRKAGVEWGAWESMNYFTIAIGAALGGAIITAFGFNVLFVIMAALCFGSALYIYRLPRRVL